MYSKKLLLVVLSLLVSVAMPAQVSVRVDKASAEEYRQQINLDYSMPDYITAKVDSGIIGKRLASMLQMLLQSTPGSTYYRYLSFIQAEQLDENPYVRVSSFSLKSVFKKGNEIMIILNTKLDSNIKGIKKAELAMRFYDSVSESHYTDELFSALARYAKE